MLTQKEIILNNIIIAMRVVISAVELQILEKVLIKEFQRVEVIERETLPATVDNTNDYIIELFKAKKAPRLSNKTVEQYLNTAKSLACLINKPFLQMETIDIEYYLQMYKEKGNSNVSINNQRRYISAFFSWMRKMKLIIENPCEQVEAWVEVEKPVDHMTPEEVEQLKSGCKKKRDRALIEFLRCTAMRREEIPQVKIRDIEWTSGKIVIYGQKSSAYRLVCLDSVAMYYMRLYLDERGVNTSSAEALFTCATGDRRKVLSDDGIYSSVKTIALRSGLNRNIYPHLFRKTTATNIIMRGGSEEAAGEYLGHKPKTVTGKHYIYKPEGFVLDIFKRYVATI